ncbi:exodeoxyribonuclease VII large subunit [Mycoplasmatota bacterium zrk1]
MIKQDYFTIKELTKYLKQKFDADTFLKNISLRGEISNFTHHSRGHFYFTLKDEFSQISAIMFSSSATKIKFKPAEGMEVIVRGYVSVYEATGKYQIYVSKMEEFGKGNINLEFQKLKDKLLKAGKLDDNIKKKIPKFPKVIGVITSPTGAAVRDIYNTINRRYPLVRMDFFPTLVQGENAKFSIVKSIDKANELNECDVLIVGRGGGSIEDLWAFNEEIVAEAIYKSNIPIISAVGHETDFTISDFIADLRAPTPTAAAELAVPDKFALMQDISSIRRHLDKTVKNKISSRMNRLNYLSNSYVFNNPIRLLSKYEIKLDNLINRIGTYSPEKVIDGYKERLELMSNLMSTTIKHRLENKTNKFIGLIEKLDILNPLNIMKKGYSIASINNNIVTSIQDVSIDDNIELRVIDGFIDLSVKSKRKDESYE